MNPPLSHLLLEALLLEKKEKVQILRYCRHSKKREKLNKRIITIEKQIRMWNIRLSTPTPSQQTA